MSRPLPPSVLEAMRNGDRARLSYLGSRGAKARWAKVRAQEEALKAHEPTKPKPEPQPHPDSPVMDESGDMVPWYVILES